MAMAAKYRIFYAWQSDTPAKQNRVFIRDAITAAVARLNTEIDIEDADAFELDHDTKGVPGSPPIAETICKKIDTCDIFVADLTTVGEYQRAADDKPKRTANANVLIELGYARKARGVERLIAVMNTVFGLPEDLPFDLKYLRHPIQYYCTADEAQRKEKQKELAKDFVAAIRAIIDTVGAREDAEQAASKAQALADGRQAAQRVREQFEAHALSNQFRDFAPKHAVLTMCLIPLTPCTVKVTDCSTTDLPPMNTLRGWGGEVYGKAYVTYEGELLPDHSRRRHTVAELNTSGSLFSATELEYADEAMPAPLKLSQMATGRIFMHTYESELLEKLRWYVQLLRGKGVCGPLYFGLSVHRVSNVLLVPCDGAMFERARLRRLKESNIIIDPLEIRDGVSYSSAKEMGKAILPALDHLWRECGLDGDPLFSDDDRIVK